MKSYNNNENRLYKLLNNSLFGRSMLENMMYSTNIKVINDESKYKRKISKDNFDDCDIVDENMITASINKSTITLDSPNYIGITILDITKAL